MPSRDRFVRPVTLVREFAIYLSSIGAGSFGSTIYTWQLPATPYVCRAVIPQGGPQPSVMDYHRLQVLCRDTNIQSVMAMAQVIYERIQQDRKPSMASHDALCEPVHPPGPWYRDENGRFVASLNFLLTCTVRVV